MSIENKNKTENSSDDTIKVLKISPDFGIISEIKINGVAVGENGLRIIDNARAEFKFNIINSSVEKNDITAILATYTSAGNLYNVRSFKIGTNGEQTSEITFDAENEYTGKLMFWNSYLMPLKATINFSQTSGINAYYYDSDNRLLQIDKADGKVLQFTYDNMGNLLTKTIRE